MSVFVDGFRLPLCNCRASRSTRRISCSSGLSRADNSVNLQRNCRYMDKSKSLDPLDLGIDSRMLLEAGGLKTTEMLERILSEVEGLLKLAPTDILQQTSEGPMHRTRFFLSWVGSAVAVINQWDKTRGLFLLSPQHDILDYNPAIRHKAYDTILMLLYEVREI
jgi:hypothetical protein